MRPRREDGGAGLREDVREEEEDLRLEAPRDGGPLDPPLLLLLPDRRPSTRVNVDVVVRAAMASAAKRVDGRRNCILMFDVWCLVGGRVAGWLVGGSG